MLEREEKAVGVIDIPEGLEPGAQTAQWVLDQIRTHPGSFDMGSWSDFCGTTHCAAGWAAMAHPDIMNKFKTPYPQSGSMEDYCDWESAGAKALRLSFHSDWDMFYLPDYAAIAALEMLAAGKPIDWQVIRELLP